MHLRGTYFATRLFSNLCMEWGGTPHSQQKKRKRLMNTTTVSPTPVVDPVAVSAKTDTSRCHSRYPNGKRCSLPGLPVHSGTCLRHSQASTPIALPVHVQNDLDDLSADLLPELSQFNSGVDINKFLPPLLILSTKGPTSPPPPPPPPSLI